MIALFRKSTEENKNELGLVRGMLYSSEEESSERGYNIGTNIQKTVGELYDDLMRPNSTSGNLIKEFGYLCSARTSARIIYGNNNSPNYRGPNIIIPRDSIDPVLAKELDKVSITEGLIDGINDYPSPNFFKRNLIAEEEGENRELKDALEELQVGQLCDIIEAMILLSDEAKHGSIEISKF